jgi:hypothetical protein
MLNFELLDHQTNSYHAINERIAFEKDMIVGDAYNTFDLKGMGVTPYEFKLLPAYPNPFNPVTNITFSISEQRNVRLSIFDIMGREVQVLENGLKESGEYSIIWDASNFASGIYYIHIAAGSSVETQKVMLIK